MSLRFWNVDIVDMSYLIPRTCFKEVCICNLEVVFFWLIAFSTFYVYYNKFRNAHIFSSIIILVQSFDNPIQ